MKSRNDQFFSKYFWLLDSETSTDFLSEYKQALDGKTDSAVYPIVSLLEAKVPVPPKAYLTSSIAAFVDKKMPVDFANELGVVLDRFERQTHTHFAGSDRPLLLNVHGDFCGSIRNIGVSVQNLKALVHHYGEATAYSYYIGFLESYSALVLGCASVDFKKTFNIHADREGGSSGLASLPCEQFGRYVKDYQNIVSQKVGRPFPDSPEKQLISTIIHCARMAKQSGGDEVFISVQMPKSQFGQAVMGVAYTRNPFSGKKDIYGVYQHGNAHEKGQIEITAEENTDHKVREQNEKSLRVKYPAAYSFLKRYLPEIEGCYRDVMEAEFVTDEDGNIFFTNFDKANTTARATVVSAVDLNLTGKITDHEAAMRIRANDVEVLLHPTLDDVSRSKLTDVGSAGVTAAPGTAVGHIFFKMADAMEFYRNAVKKKTDPRVILIADELLISDTPGLGIIKGLVTKASGIASHAAVMARANGIPCIVGYKGLELDYKNNSMSVNGKKLSAGTLMTLEAGSEGKLFLGEGSLQNLSFKEGLVRDVAQLMARVIRSENIPLEVRVNINNAKDADTGLSFGASGVGLCRTENMFMEEEALREIRNIVFSQDPEMCKESLDKLEETQYQDFKKIFEVMRERTVNIRLMDLPLHDFVPQTEAAFTQLIQQLKHLDETHIRGVAETLREHNPMLGLRACRFGLIKPQVYEMQIRAITRAAYAVAQTGVQVKPGIMFPLVFSEQELTRLKAKVLKIEEETRVKLKVPYGTKIHFKVGSMIELPAATLAADKLAKVGEFFAFGTNDLTQTSLGMSRDDSSHYLPFYIEQAILPSDPFKVLHPAVKELIENAVTRGRRVRRDASFGICGEQGGDKATLTFCLERNINYVSCSPFRVLPSIVSLVHVAAAFKESQEQEVAARQPSVQAGAA